METLNMYSGLRPAAGFTLIEVLVALFMVSLSLLAGFRAAGSMTANTERQWQMLLAQLCADNTLVQLRLNPQFAELGEHTTPCPQAERAFAVVTTVAATPNPSFRRVDVHVSDGATPLLRVSGLVGRY
ncbi:MAG: type II secretion system minor pseudopilin GspI [Burkholderiales bacterium]|jgi:general secretion pathway protein I